MMKQLKNRKLGRELINQGKEGKLRDFSRSEVTGMIRDINIVKPMNFAISKTKGKWTTGKGLGVLGAAGGAAALHNYATKPYEPKEEVAEKAAVEPKTEFVNDPSGLINASNLDEKAKGIINKMIIENNSLKRQALTAVNDDYMTEHNLYPARHEGGIFGIGKESEEDYEARKKEAMKLYDHDRDGYLDSDEKRLGYDTDPYDSKGNTPAPFGTYSIVTEDAASKGKELADAAEEVADSDEVYSNWDHLMDTLFDD